MTTSCFKEAGTRGIRACLATVTGIALSLTLSACGGSGDSEETKLPTAAVSVDSSVPAAAIAKIAEVSTLAGQAKYGEAVSTPILEAGGQATIFATDAKNEILFAGVLSKGEPTARLTAESTALVFALMAYGPPPPGVSTADLLAAVKGSSAFSGVVAKIATHQAAGTPPMGDAAVVGSLLEALAQALAKLAPPKAQAATAHRLELATPTARQPLPFKALTGGPLGWFTITVTGADQATNGVLVKNEFPINFAARGLQPVDGTLIQPVPVGLDFNAQIALSSGDPLSFFSATPVAIPGNGKAWNLEIFRSDVSRILDIKDSIKGIIETGLLFEPSGILTCLRDASADVINDAPVFTWVTLPKNQVAASISSYMGQPATWQKFFVKSAACTGGSNQISEFLEKRAKDPKLQEGFLRHINQFALLGSKGLGFLGGASTVGGLLVKAYYMIEYWDTRFKVGICQNKGPDGTGPLQVITCPVALALTPAELNLHPGASHKLHLIALDAQSATVPLPSGLRYSSSAPAIADVDQEGRVTAKAASDTPVSITVKEDVFGLESVVVVHVTSLPQPTAALTVSPVKIVVDEPVTLTWSSVNTEKCQAQGNWSGQLATSGTQKFTPPSPGSYVFTLACSGPNGDVTASATLQVDAPPQGSGVITLSGDAADFGYKTFVPGTTILPKYIVRDGGEINVPPRNGVDYKLYSKSREFVWVEEGTEAPSYIRIEASGSGNYPVPTDVEAIPYSRISITVWVKAATEVYDLSVGCYQFPGDSSDAYNMCPQAIAAVKATGLTIDVRNRVVRFNNVKITGMNRKGVTYLNGSLPF